MPGRIEVESMSSFPPPASSSIDWNNVGFKVREVNGHIECSFKHSSAEEGKPAQWGKPRFVSSPFLPIHGMAPGLNYGVQCYEGMKAYRNPDGKITIFRPQKNAKRMQTSAEYICVPPVPEELYVEAVNLAVACNAEFVPTHESGASMYIRPLLLGTSAQLGLNPPDEYLFVVFVMPTGVYHGAGAVDALILEDFDRCAPEGTGCAKIGGNYAPVLRHSERAAKQGYGITLHLDSKTRTEIDEFSTSGFIGIKEGDDGKHTIVVPDSKNVIQSVTSDSITTIARDMLGMNYERRPIKWEELPEFKEVMACGTAVSLAPIKSVTLKSKDLKAEYPIPEKGMPEFYTKLITTLKSIQMGKIEDQFGWNHTVTAPPKGFVSVDANGTNGENVDSLP